MEPNKNNELRITDILKEYLLEASKWAYFISIIGFISLGLLVLSSFFMGSVFAYLLGTMGAFGELGGYSFIAIYLIIALIYYFPIKYLFDFSRKVKKSILENDQETFVAGFSKLKSHYKYIGVLTIIGICFYVLIIIFTIVAAVAANSSTY